MEDNARIRTCPSCGMTNRSFSHFCNHCGAALDNPQVLPVTSGFRKCSNCGANVPIDMQFCTNCGETIGTPIPKPDEQPPEQDSSAQISRDDNGTNTDDKIEKALKPAVTLASSSAPQKKTYSPPRSSAYSEDYEEDPFRRIAAQRSNPIPPPSTYIPSSSLAPIVNTSEFFWLSILYAVPVIGLIVFLCYAFDESVNPNKRNYCKAMLIQVLVSVGLVILFWTAISSILAGILGSLGGGFF